MTGYGAAGIARERVTCTGLGRDCAAACLVSDERNLSVLLYNMTEEPKAVGVRPWELAPGSVYKVRMGVDSDGDAGIDEGSEEIEWTLPQRGVALNFTLPPREQFVVEAASTGEGAAAELMPDVGISREDIEYNSNREMVVVSVHNVGSKEARGVKVAVYKGDPDAGGEKIGEQVIPRVPAPLDLDPQIVRAGFQFNAAGEKHEIYAVIDPDDEIEEITNLNNRASARVGP